MAFIISSYEVYGQRSSSPIYEKAFDLGAGGASLTRASADGVIFANPALLPWGSGQARWDGGFIQIAPSTSISNTISNAASGGGLSDEDTAEIQEQVFGGDPVALEMVGGAGTAATNYAFGQYQLGGLDMRVQSFGDESPGAQVKAEYKYYTLTAGSLAFKPLKWMSLGATFKQLSAQEGGESIPVDPAAISSFDPGYTVQSGTGVGYDVGSLFFWKNRTFDMQLAYTVENIGGMALGEELDAFKQSQNVGTSIAFHTGSAVIHMALDYRDLGGVYGESLYKRLHAGTRALFISDWGIGVGVSTGVYHGRVTAGFILDLKFIRLSYAQYSREKYNLPGLERTDFKVFNISFGG